jgi:hypothetical protein
MTQRGFIRQREQTWERFHMSNSEAEWRQWWMDDAWVEWWKSLDHSNCGVYDLGSFPATYLTCRDMHCPDCGKKTGSQGHINCPERVS